VPEKQENVEFENSKKKKKKCVKMLWDYQWHHLFWIEN